MPMYCYKTKDGKTLEEYFKFGEAPDKVIIHGKDSNGDFVNDVYIRDIQAELLNLSISTRSNEKRKTWPLTCYASGVNANQAQELRNYLGKRGCKTEVTEDGDPIYTSAAHRKKALKLRGMHDRNSFC